MWKTVAMGVLVISGLVVSTTARAADWTERISLFGDFRGRYEGFFFDTDSLGNQKSDRHRARYRLRLGATAQVNDFIDVQLRLATGPDANSGNQTLGSGNDFDPDGVFLDQAFATIHPFAHGAIPLAGKRADLIFGKMSNPFRSKVGKDLIVWDGDITPEGVALRYLGTPSNAFSIGFDAGYLIFDENSGSGDPHVTVVQLEPTLEISDSLTVGGAASYYAYGSLDADFLARGAFAKPGFGKSFGGNIPGGLNGNRRSADIVDLRGFAAFSGIENWPVRVYGNFTRNLSAERQPAFNAGKEDTAWSLGIEVGDKRKFAQVGVGYFRVEANAIPANQTDSDLFDGRTNGKGFAVYGARQLFEHADFKTTVLISDALDAGITHVDAVENHNRVRLQMDLVLKF